jgi:hypothetical protein
METLSSLHWNLQYPGEKEITFPPFSCLETDGEARVEWTKQGEIVVFPLKVVLKPLLQSINIFKLFCKQSVPKIQESTAGTHSTLSAHCGQLSPV